jgi:hypothetical protein
LEPLTVSLDSAANLAKTKPSLSAIEPPCEEAIIHEAWKAAVFLCLFLFFSFACKCYGIQFYRILSPSKQRTKPLLIILSDRVESSLGFKD